MKKSDLAIICPVLNCLNYTKQFLKQVLKFTNCSTIIINNASTDGTKDFLKRFEDKRRVWVINNDKNIGVGASWNKGIYTARAYFDSKYYFIPNNDILLQPDTMDKMLKVLKRPNIALTSAYNVKDKIKTPDLLQLETPPKKLELTEAPDFSCFMLKDETIKKVLREFKVVNADVLIRSPIDVDDLIDCIEGNKKYVPAITCITKADLATVADVSKAKKELNADLVISAEEGLNIAQLREMIFQKLDFIRVYMKEPRKEADMKEPMIIFKGATIRDVCLKTHKDFVTKFRFARVWGESAKFNAQKVMLNHKLKDEDILEMHIR